MAMQGVNYDVKCMMCSAEVGQIWAGKFRQHDCGKTMPVLAGMARCCHCGGSLYLDPNDLAPSTLDRAEVQRAMAEQAA